MSTTPFFRSTSRTRGSPAGRRTSWSVSGRPSLGGTPRSGTSWTEYGAQLARGELGRVRARVRSERTGPGFPLSTASGVSGPREGKQYLFATVKDLSEQRKFEARLKESETTFRRIAETTTDAIYQLDLNGMLIYCSPAVEKILGFKPEEFVGTSFRSHFLPEDLPPAQDIFVRNLTGEEIRNAELRIIGKNGKLVDIEINATPMRKDGKIIGSQGIARDITERKKAGGAAPDERGAAENRDREHPVRPLSHRQGRAVRDAEPHEPEEVGRALLVFGRRMSLRTPPHSHFGSTDIGGSSMGSLSRRRSASRSTGRCGTCTSSVPPSTKETRSATCWS